MNKIIICGRLTRDPEVRTGNNTSVARYSVAVDRKFKQEGKPTADFFNCTAFGKSAEFAEKWLKKGTKVLLTGRMEQDNYTDNNGNKVYSWQLIVEEQEFAESKKASEDTAAAKPSEEPEGYVEITDDMDLPFV